ncbi:MAG: hypothetical protein AAFQ10_10590 [Pseudomonadota bacterium]
MSSIPDYAWGWRRGYRAVVSTLHAFAILETDHHTQSVLNGRASRLGIDGRERFQQMLNMPDEPTPPPHLMEAAQRHAKGTWRLEERHLGFLMGIRYGIDNLRAQASRFNDPKAIAAVIAFAERMEAHLAMLLIADDVPPRRGAMVLE